MHTCKVKSTKPANIQKNEYMNIYKKVHNEDFANPYAQVYRQFPHTSISQFVFEEKTFSLPMKRNLFRLLEIKGKINQHKVTLLIDTGAQISAMRCSLFEKLNLKAYPPLEIGSFGGSKIDLETVVVEEFAFGKMKVLNHPMIVLGEDTLQMKIGPLNLIHFDAILGWDILSRIDFELDDIAHQFKVIENTYRFKYPNFIKGSFPFMIGRRQNELVKLGIDTGSYYSWISKDYMETNQMEKMEIETLSYGVHGKEKNASQMALHYDVLLDRGYIVLSELIQGPCQIFSHFKYDAVLGNEIFKGRRIRFLNSASMVLFT